LRLVGVLLFCCLLANDFLKGSAFFLFLMGMAYLRGYLWGIGGHIRWGSPEDQYETGLCAPNCPACIKHLNDGTYRGWTQ